MAYIILDDYSLRIAPIHLSEILSQAILGTGLTVDQARANAENFSMATIKSYLISQYDIAGEFAKVNTDATRNYQVLAALIDIAIHTLHLTINPRDIPEHVDNQYRATLHWLVEARDARIILDLPGPVDKTLTDPNATKDMHFPETFISSQVKFVSKPYSDSRLFDTELGNKNVIPSS